ncbi:hypothetical protein CYJ27_01145 [Aerococcus christensenii]|uniref:Regulatory protein YycH-like domain-containing protein n=1 Tax=Aerococcus christensenii TaxID=87541 RepID=A0A109RC62_9LACT|nr:two-component system regulatory protein YycI [Aerococcus christensenii]AMB92201.1 hypothetical protein AWM71_02185 [Aerococcus christensenii]PKY92070.1 hypothetical protein CYJ27_01145 [Aerococcus christensenii]
MDFRRIENILIIAFFLLNTFLAYTLFGKNMLMTSLSQDNINIEQELKANEINLTFDLSSEEGKEPFIAGKQQKLSTEGENRPQAQRLKWDKDTGQLYGEFAHPIALKGLKQVSDDPTRLPNEVLSPINKLLTEGSIEEGESYRFLVYNRQRKMIYYGQVGYDDRLITDSTARLIFHLNDQNEIVSYEMSHIQKVQPQGQVRSLISSKKAVENLYLYNEIPSKSSVVSAQLSYQQTLRVEDIIVYKPVWAIVIRLDAHSLKTVYVDGINGTIIQNPSDLLPKGQGGDNRHD